ncbi:MAG: DUF308 domain-containing protein [Ignavibacteriaceae bacterium]|nr:DUF308 domain-containing protein [Ignavibacteriaceae bacterium]
MINENIDKENIIVRHSNLNLMKGFILILVSLWVFCNTDITYISLAKIFSITLLFTGILEIMSSIQNKDFLTEWGFCFAMGILDILVSISVIILSQYQISTELLTLIMGYFFLYRTFKLIFWSTELKNYTAISCGWVLFGIIVGVILTFLLVWNQPPSLSAIIFFTSYALLVIGISEIYISSMFRKLKPSKQSASL